MCVRRRPLFLAALALISGIILGRYGVDNILLLFALAVSSLASAFLFHRLRPVVSQVALIGAIVATGALLYIGSRLPAEALYLRSREWEYIQGVVANYPIHIHIQRPEEERKWEWTSFILRPRDSPGYLRVFYFHKGEKEPLQIDYGDELRIYAQVKWPEELEGFNYREYLLRRGIWGTVSIWSRREIKLVAQGRGSLILEFGYHIRERLFRFIERHIPHHSDLLLALLFERGYLGEELEAQFRDAGVAHILAVSGLHLGIILGLFWLILRCHRFHLSVGISYAILFLVTTFYLLLVGFRVSLLRAAIMFAFLGLGVVLAERGLILRRWADPYQSLSAAALVILGLWPQALFDASFQLSFVATLGIIFFTPRLEGSFMFIRPRWLRELITVSLGAQLGVIPAVAWHFHRLYLLVIPANLVVIPLVTFTLWGGVGFLLLGPTLPPLAPYLGRAEGWLLEALDRVTAQIAESRLSYLQLKGLSLWICLGLYLILLATALVSTFLRSRRERPPSPERGR